MARPSFWLGKIGADFFRFLKPFVESLRAKIYFVLWYLDDFFWSQAKKRSPERFMEASLEIQDLMDKLGLLSYATKDV